MNKIHCKATRPTKNRIRGTLEECIKKKQVTYYGIRAISAKDRELYFGSEVKQESPKSIIKKSTLTINLPEVPKPVKVTLKKKKTPPKKKVTPKKVKTKEEIEKEIQEEKIRKKENLEIKINALKKKIKETNKRLYDFNTETSNGFDKIAELKRELYYIGVDTEQIDDFNELSAKDKKAIINDKKRCESIREDIGILELKIKRSRDEANILSEEVDKMSEELEQLTKEKGKIKTIVKDKTINMPNVLRWKKITERNILRKIFEGTTQKRLVEKLKDKIKEDEDDDEESEPNRKLVIEQKKLEQLREEHTALKKILEKLLRAEQKLLRAEKKSSAKKK